MFVCVCVSAWIIIPERKEMQFEWNAWKCIRKIPFVIHSVILFVPFIRCTCAISFKFRMHHHRSIPVNRKISKVFLLRLLWPVKREKKECFSELEHSWLRFPCIGDSIIWRSRMFSAFIWSLQNWKELAEKEFAEKKGRGRNRDRETEWSDFEILFLIFFFQFLLKLYMNCF